MPQDNHAEIYAAIKTLPEGTKEQAAWEKLGLVHEQRTTESGEKYTIVTGEKLPRHAFRELWLKHLAEKKKQDAKKPEAKPKKS